MTVRLRDLEYDVVDGICRHESGDLGWDETLKLFQHLVDTGIILHLQGSYQRYAQMLLDDGFIFKH